MNNKYVDNRSIIQVLGTLYKHPHLFDEKDKYFISTDDFVEPFHKLIYSAMHNLRLQNLGKIELLDIDNYLSSKPGLHKIYEDNKGAEYLVEASSKCEYDNFNYYFNRLKKFSLMRGLHNLGIDMTGIYDPNEIFDTKKIKQQNEWLENVSLEDIPAIVNDRIESVKHDYLGGMVGDGQKMGSGALSLIDKLQEIPEIGVPLYGNYINKITRGARLKKFYLRSAPTGCGKAIPNYTLIPTPLGWRTVGEIQAGDFIYGQDGTPTKVIQIHPQPKKKDVWEVEFSDGRVAECCDEHLWEYRYETDGGKAYRTESLGDIFKRVGSLKSGLRNADESYKFHVRVNEAVQFNSKELPLDPYTLGLLICYLNKELNDVVMESIAKYKETLKDIWDCNKFLPEEYLTSSIEQRYSLLQGLLDANGSVDCNGRVSFTTESESLKNGVVELCRSLGIVASVSNEVCYTVHISCKEELKSNLFRLETKRADLNKSKDYKGHLAIVDIRRTDKKEDMTCFTVDNKDHLFLMNDFIVTHNTRTMMADACNIACDEIYNNRKWVSNGQKEPTLFITTELEIDECQTMALAFLSNVNEDNILDGKYSNGELERVVKAANILSNCPIWVEHIPDFSLTDIEGIIRRHVRENGVKYVFFDYIHTSLKILAEVSKRSGGMKLREDNILFMLSARLKDLANELGIFIMSATQLNGSYEEEKEANQNMLRGSKAIADRLDFGSILLPVTETHKQCLSELIQKNGLPMPNLSLSIYKNRRGKYKSVILWCHADLGTCRVNPMFMTDSNFNYIPISDINIIVKAVEDDVPPAGWSDK